MDNNIVVAILCIGSVTISFFSFSSLVIAIYLSNRNFKKINNKIDEIATDLSDAMTKTIELISKEFKENAEMHQVLTDWEHSMFEKTIQNSSENFNFIAKQEYFMQNLLSNLLDSLGFRSRFDESNIEKPQRNYSDPPPPVELEGLKIKDGKPDRKK